MQTARMVRQAKKTAKRMTWGEWASLAATAILLPMLFVAMMVLGKRRGRERITAEYVPQR